MNVGLEIARVRRRAGLTQAELAKRMGTTQSAVSRLESGGAGATVDLLERVAKAIGFAFTLTFGATALSDRRKESVRRVLGDYRFNPWERLPTDAEARSLARDGLTRERFESPTAAD